MNPFLTIIVRHQTKIENVLAFLVIISAVFRILHWPGGAELLMISMSSLAVYYFISTYFPSPLENVYATIAWKIVGITSSICVIGILFSFLHMPGAANMLLIGVCGLFISGMALLIFAMRQWSYKFLPLFIRIAFFTYAGASMLWLASN
jgi:hypothetical protein